MAGDEMAERVSHGHLHRELRAGLAAITLFLVAASRCFAQDWSDPRALAQFSSRLVEQYPTIRSVVVARRGCLEFEYYKAGLNALSLLPVHSIAKSVLSILVGIALDKGYLHIDQKLSEILPEALDPTMDPRVRDITVRDLLTMTSGFDSAPFGARAVVPPRAIWQWTLARSIQYAPGSQFNYDDDSVNLLSVALTRAVRQSSRRFAENNLFRPLKIANFDWKADSDGNLIGASTLSLTARDMAKLGVLYLQHGRWAGEQIVSSEYVADSTAKHNDGGTPTRAAYGYLWWVTHTGSGLEAFFAAGSGSQIIYAVPRLGLVVAVASLSNIPGGSVRFVNDIVLPAIGNEAAAGSCIAQLGEEDSPRKMIDPGPKQAKMLAQRIARPAAFSCRSRSMPGGASPSCLPSCRARRVRLWRA